MSWSPWRATEEGHQPPHSDELVEDGGFVRAQAVDVDAALSPTGHDQGAVTLHTEEPTPALGRLGSPDPPEPWGP